MTSFKEEAARRRIAAGAAKEIASENQHRLEQRIERIVQRVEQEKEWLEAHNIRVFFDNESELWDTHLPAVRGRRPATTF